MKSFAALKGAIFVLFILAVVAGWYFLPQSGSNESMQEMHAAAALKQEIVGLKARRNSTHFGNSLGAKIGLPPEFEIALRAELRGDEQCDNKDYPAAQKSYVEALSNFKKALEEFEIGSASQTLPEAISNQGRTKPNPAAPPVARAIDEEIENFSKKSLERERKLLAAAESQKMLDQKPTAFTPEPFTPKPNIEQNTRATAIKAATPDEKLLEESPRQGDANPEKVAAAISETGNSEPQTEDGAAREGRLEPAEALDQSISNLDRGMQSDAQQRNQWEATAKHDIANLLGAYQSRLASKDLDGLKALLHESFAAAHEKAWSDFFAQATNVRASVEGKNYKIAEARGEVDLVITMQYSNRKGIGQKPLRYSERWTLERLNGIWTVVARRFE